MASRIFVVVFALSASAPFWAGCGAADEKSAQPGKPDGGGHGDHPDASFCAEDTDCGDGLVCKAGQCVPKPDCTPETEKQDCGQLKFCNTLTGKCAFYDGIGDQCEKADECNFGYFCDKGICKQGTNDCESNRDCGEGYRCSKELMLCVSNLCFVPEHCEQGEECNTEANVCIAVAEKECEDTSDCAESETCSPEGKCVQCVIDTDCGPGLRCKRDTGQCVSQNYCDTDADCQGGLVCLEQHVCGQPPPPCRDDDECSEGKICDFQSGRCVPGCHNDSRCSTGTYCDIPTSQCVAGCNSDARCTRVQYCDMETHACVPFECSPDSYEPNNDSSEPGDLPAEEATHENLTFCGGDDTSDWYRITVPAGTYLRVTINFSHSRGDIDMKLFNESNPSSSIDSSTGVSDSETVEVNSASEAAYLINTYIFAETITSYSLTVALEEGVACADDEMEPNDEVSAAGRIQPGTVSDLLICEQDEDFFKLNVPAMKRIMATLNAFGTPDGLRIEILDAGGAEVLDEDTSYAYASSDTLEVKTLISTAGDYYLHVAGNGADTLVRYDLTVEITDPCGMDSLEPSVSAERPSVLPARNATYENLAVCSDDEDWYSITIEPGTLLKANLSFTDDDGDIDMKLFGASDPETSIDSSTGGGDSEQVEYNARVGGTFLVKVFLYSADENTYSMTVTLEAGELCPDDPLEADPGNDTPQTAGVAAIGEISSLTLCGADPDWFKIHIAANEWITATVNITSGSASGSAIKILDPDGRTVLTEATVSGASTSAYIQVPAEADYYVLVEGAAMADAGYKLTLSTNPPCGYDQFEPNNSKNDAKQLSSGTFELALCRRDLEDWFKFTLGAGEAANITATFVDADGDIEMKLYNANNQEVGSSTGTDNDEAINYTSSQAGDFYLKIYVISYGITADNNPYTLVISGLCDDDAYEPNSTREDAKPIAEGSYADLMICSDDDWYKFTVEGAASPVTVSVEFIDADGDIDLRLYNEAGDTVLAESRTKHDVETIQMTLDPADYLIKVSIDPRYSKRQNGYQMTLAIGE